MKPDKPSLHWARLEEENGKQEIVLLRIGFYTGSNSFDDGILCYFVDGSDFSFEMHDFDQEIVRPSRIYWNFAGKGSEHRPHVKVTWLKPLRYPKPQTPVT